MSKTAYVFYGLAGLTGPGSAFGPPSFGGLPFSQAAFLQGGGSSIGQRISGFSPGNYTLSLYLGSRGAGWRWDGEQTVEALVDGNVIATWSLSGSMPFTLKTASFTISTGGAHVMEFDGTHFGDHTAFLSCVRIVPQ